MNANEKGNLTTETQRKTLKQWGSSLCELCVSVVNFFIYSRAFAVGS